MSNGCVYRIVSALALAAELTLAGAQTIDGMPAQTTSAPASADESAIHLGLDEALAAAMKNQPLIHRASAAVEAARAREAQARSAYLPNISGAASYSYLQPVEAFTVQGLGSMDMSDANNYDFHFSLSQLVFDFGKRDIQVKLAREGADAASIDLAQIRTSIAYQTARTFYSALFLRSERKVLDEQFSTLSQHLADVELRKQTGSSTRYDVLTTQVRVASVQSQRIEAEARYSEQIMALQEMTGIQGELEPEGGFEPRQVALDAAAAVDQAIAGRDEVRQAVSAERQAELSLALAKMGNRPTISAMAEAGWKNGLFTLANTDLDNLVFNWNAGVVLNVPIFDGLLAQRKSTEADARLEAARENSKALRQSAKTQILQALKEADSSRRQTDNSLAQLAQAEEALSIAKVQYAIGASTNLQYIDSQTSLELARLNNLGSLYREALSRLALEQALGEEQP